ncbi:thiol reductant ABC exporter subunit CydC [Thiotrichales bacterium 19S11-10]|nr:thiol reductant ABC exporter subunit CydC [Thiotrichales bacterium 19S11-10]
MFKHYKVLLPIFKRQLWWMILSTGLSIATLLSSIGLMSLSGWFISATAYAGLSYQAASQFNFFLPGTGVRFFSLSRTGCRYGERVISHEATFKILSNLRLWAYQKLEPLAPAHLILHKKGDLLSRMVSDVDQLDHLFIRILSPTASAVIIAIFSLCFFSFFNIHIAIITFISLLVSGFLIPFIVGIIASKTAKKINQITFKLKTETVDLVHGISELIIFNQIDHQQEKIKTLNNKLTKQQHKMASFEGIGKALTQCILWITIIICLYIAVIATNEQKLNGANIALIALGLLAMYESVMALSSGYQHLGKINQAAKRLSDLALIKPSVRFNNIEHINIKKYDISFNSVSFTYTNRELLLNQVTLSFPHNSKTALIGKTGSGKSTILQLICRIFDTQHGQVEIGNIDIKSFSEKQLRQLIVIVEQHAHLFQMSIRDNLKIANANATDEEIYHALALVSLKQHIQSLPNQLDTLVSEFGENFSGGQRKRLMLARAVLHGAPIILLDEPTENLDYKTELDVLQAIEQISKNKTLILSTHSPTAINKMDRIISL